MSNQTSNQGDTDYRPCDNRYRTSKYFLDDQLKCSSAVSDFNAVKSALSKVPAFTAKFGFIPVPVPVAVRVKK